MNYEKAKEYLRSFVSYEEMSEMPYADFDPDRVADFLKEYGVNYQNLKYVHVAGSKGKGSTCRMIADYLRSAGYKVGLYTSPHITEVTERFWLDGQDIGKMKFAKCVEELKNFMEKRGENLKLNLTYFEILTVIALKIFVNNGVDYAVLEVGLGGRLDATNVVKPELSIITTVELEHVGILGNNLSEILDEKLGIVKDGVPVLIGYQRDEALKIIRRKLGKKMDVFHVGDFFDGNAIPDFSKSCLDVAKLKNANVAFAALEILLKKRGKVDIFLFRQVVADFKLPGRFDVRRINKSTVVFDMAHTKSSIENLTDALLDNFPGKKFVFLIAIMKGKNISGILEQIDKVADKIVLTNAHERRGILAEDLRKIAEKLDLRSSTQVTENCVDAYVGLLKNIKKEEVIVVTGSHFLVGKIL